MVHSNILIGMLSILFYQV